MHLRTARPSSAPHSSQVAVLSSALNVLVLHSALLLLSLLAAAMLPPCPTATRRADAADNVVHPAGSTNTKGH
jgi:hypothetical protein